MYLTQRYFTKKQVNEYPMKRESRVLKLLELTCLLCDA